MSVEKALISVKKDVVLLGVLKTIDICNNKEVYLFPGHSADAYCLIDIVTELFLKGKNLRLIGIYREPQNSFLFNHRDI
jgi:hypothetical protein